MKRIVFVILALTMIFQSCGKDSGGGKLIPGTPVQLTVQVGGIDNITDFGDVKLPLPAEDLLSAGYAYSDMLDVEILGEHFYVPLIDDFSLLEAGRAAMVATKGENAQIGILIGLFAVKCGMADCTVSEGSKLDWTLKKGVSFPVEVKISLKEAKGYKDVYDALSKSRSKEFQPDAQTEEQFCNFRDLGEEASSGGKIGKGIIYRGASPLDNTYGRRDLSDSMMEKYGIRTVANLADTHEKAKSYEKYSTSVYSRLNVAYCKFTNLEPEIAGPVIASAVRHIITNEPPYFFHCQEGKDRTGLFAALLEGFMGADAQQILDDDMLSFLNYYNVRKGSRTYEIMSSHIFTLLSMIARRDITFKSDIPAECKAILLSIGLSEEELAALHSRLAPVE